MVVYSPAPMLKVSLTIVVGQGAAQPDGLAQIVDVQQLVAVVAAADHGEAAAVLGPVVEQGEDAQALGADEALGPDDRHDHALLAELLAHAFGFDLGHAVGADAVQLVVLQQGVVVGNAVDRGGGDVHEPPHAVRLRPSAGAARVPSMPVVTMSSSGYSGRAMAQWITRSHAVHGLVHGLRVADVAGDDLDAVLAVGVVELAPDPANGR